MKQLVPVLVLSALAVGCATQPASMPALAPQPAPVSSVLIPPPPNPTESIMAYVLKVRNMGNSVLTDEIQRERDALSRERNDLHRIKLAVLLIQTGNADETEVLALVDPVTQEQVDPNLRALAVLLHTTLGERRRTRESLLSTQVRLREAQKTQESTQTRNDQLKKQVEDLERKLTALKSIEQSLIQRK
jgi:hypothetical protein